jgi:hypothetical protein
MMYIDPETHLHIDADFEGGSGGAIRQIDTAAYAIEPKPESVPDWFLKALDQHFGGAGVPREYAFHVRLRSSATDSVQCRIRFVFTQTSGKGYMAPPYWMYTGDRWRPVADEQTRFVEREYVDLTVTVAPGEEIRLANKPYASTTRIQEDMHDLALRADGLFSLRELGRTRENRPLLALETELRDETVLVAATMQPAEPAARPVMAVAHWLTDRGMLTERLLDRFQFCFIPLPNPDGTANGRSVTNAVGEVPMFSFGHVVRGEPAPAESEALWRYAQQVKPAAYMEFHTHYQDNRFHKLNPMSLDWFPEPMHERVRRVDDALMHINSAWRVTPLTPDLPLVECGKFANLTAQFHTLSYCYQIYTVTEEATCAHAVTVISTLAQALAGPGWAAEQPEVRVERG